MKEIIDSTWDLLGVAVAQAKEKDENIIRNDASKDIYDKTFRLKYNFIKDNFMKESVKYLDRHKVTSIIISSIIEADAVVYKGNIPENNTFFGKYLIAVSVGLSYMQSKLNKLLKEKKQKEISEYYFPSAFSCNTHFFEIFARNLYFTHELTDWKLNLLDMSENLFMIEYMTLEKNGIDPRVLADSSDSEKN